MPKSSGSAPRYTGERIDRIGVVVPVSNETQGLESCLDALDIAVSRVTVPVTVVVVLTASGDDSASAVRGFPAAGTEVMVVAAGSVGSARAAGMAEVLKKYGAAGTWLATTDADALVPPHWLSAQLRHADAGARVVAGSVTDQHGAGHGGWTRKRRHLHGANLSFAAAAYCATEGFQAACDDDVLLVDAFTANAEPIAWAIDLAVVTQRVPVPTSREGG